MSEDGVKLKLALKSLHFSQVGYSDWLKNATAREELLLLNLLLLVTLLTDLKLLLEEPSSEPEELED